MPNSPGHVNIFTRLGALAHLSGGHNYQLLSREAKVGDDWQCDRPREAFKNWRQKWLVMRVLTITQQQEMDQVRAIDKNNNHHQREQQQGVVAGHDTV